MWILPHFLYLFIQLWILWFTILAIVYKAAINMIVPVSLWFFVFKFFFGYITCCGNDGAKSKCFFQFFEISTQAFIVTGLSDIPTDSAEMMALLPRSHQDLLLSVSWMLAVLTMVDDVSLSVICISLMASDWEEFLIDLLMIYISSFGNCLLKSLVNFTTRFVVFVVEFFELFI